MAAIVNSTLTLRYDIRLKRMKESKVNPCAAFPRLTPFDPVWRVHYATISNRNDWISNWIGCVQFGANSDNVVNDKSERPCYSRTSRSCQDGTVCEKPMGGSSRQNLIFVEESTLSFLREGIKRYRQYQRFIIKTSMTHIPCHG